MTDQLFESQAASVFAAFGARAGRDDVRSRFGIGEGALGAEEAVPRGLWVSVETLGAYASALATELDAPNMGLRLGQALPRGVYGLFEYVVRTAPTLRHVCERMTRYHALVNPVIRFAFEASRKDAVIRHFVVGRAEALGRQTNELVVASMLQWLRELRGEAFVPTEVVLAHGPPPDLAEHRAYFRCPLRWNGGENRLTFPADLLSAPVPVADGALAQVLERQAEAVLATIPVPAPHANPWMASVRRRVAELLSDGTPTAALVARPFRMSVRTLHRRLADGGLTFHALLDDVRRELAEGWMRDERRSLSEIAFMLGFSELSSFTRAYKRWTGAAPSRSRLGR